MNGPDAGALRVELLGPLRLRRGDAEVATGGPKLRAILAMLALAGGRTVSVDDLLDGVWGEELPATARNTLQYHVGVLRKALAAQGAAACLVTRDPGYALVAETDVAVFLQLSTRAGRLSAAGQTAESADTLTDALNLWHGHALADLRSFEFAEARAVVLEDQRLTCLEAWAEARLACGHAEGLIPSLQELVTENPTRERLWEQLMVALYRTGRQDAALSAYRTARRALDRELGVEPTARLASVHQAILLHAPELELVPALRDGPARVLTSTTLRHSELPTAPPALIGPGGIRVVLDETAVVLGRHADCDLVLADDQASRRHARVEPAHPAYAVVDLGSTNGTFVNGRRVDGRRALRDGDRIELGHSVVRYVGRADSTPTS